jgi:hypothetical protein
VWRNDLGTGRAGVAVDVCCVLGWILVCIKKEVSTKFLFVCSSAGFLSIRDLFAFSSGWKEEQARVGKWVKGREGGDWRTDFWLFEGNFAVCWIES